MIASGTPIDPESAPDRGGAPDQDLEAFHRGDSQAIEQCYRDHFDTIDAAVGSVLDGADRETVIHEVFCRLMASSDLRRAFRGGAMGAWLATVARHQAIDHRRRLAREVALPPDGVGEPTRPLDCEAEARLLVEQFRRQRLRAEWQSVFELRFLRQLSQREAAAALRITRTTLVYRELRIRRALKAFLMEDEP